MTFSTKMFGPARKMARHGRFGDTILAHINPKEAALLKARGGSGTINPKTGAMEFANREDFDADFYLDQYQDVTKAGYGSGNPDDENFLDPFEHYQTYGRFEGRSGNVNEQQVQDLGAYTGAFDEDFYLSNNQDVSDAIDNDLLGGLSARDHFNIFGQSEKRTTNQLQQDLKEGGFGGRFGRNQGMSSYEDNVIGGGKSDRATARTNFLGGNTTGRTPEELAEMGPFGTNYLNQNQTNIADNLVGSGDFAYDLLGGTAGLTAQQIIDQLSPRKDAVDSGFIGNFDPNLMTAYTNDYTDFDNDASTNFSAPNTSNISRGGEDITQIRNAIRGIGYEGRFGTGEAETYINDQLSELGLTSTGDLARDINAVKSQQGYQTRISELEDELDELLAARNAPPVTTQPLTTGDTSTGDIPTDVSVGVPQIALGSNADGTIPSAPTAGRFNDTTGFPSFRRTRINPFTGALEYLPPSTNFRNAFSQSTETRPRFSSGFGNTIRL